VHQNYLQTRSKHSKPKPYKLKTKSAAAKRYSVQKSTGQLVGHPSHLSGERKQYGFGATPETIKHRLFLNNKNYADVHVVHPTRPVSIELSKLVPPKIYKSRDAPTIKNRLGKEGVQRIIPLTPMLPPHERDLTELKEKKKAFASKVASPQQQQKPPKEKQPKQQKKAETPKSEQPSTPPPSAAAPFAEAAATTASGTPVS
jgi:hypothetical protein